LITLVASFMLILIGVLSRDVGVVGNFVIISTFVIFAPQLLLRYEAFRDLKDMEERFPTFLRDLTENIRSGMPFHTAIRLTAKSQYGKLSREIKKMSDQISWGMTLDRVLNQFADRVKKSKRLFTSIKIIRESYLSGGDVVATLESIADNSTMLEESEKEKKSMLNQYVVLMYAISLIFIAIVVSINRLLVPIFDISTPEVAETIGLSNPCDTCVDFTCSVCSLFQGTAYYVFSLDPSGIASYYTSLFFFMSLIQSLFSGLVAGQISENSVTAGIKHSLILVAITFGSFSILVRLGVLGV